MYTICFLQSRGIGLYVEAGMLRANPASRLTPELRSFIRAHREEPIASLATPDLDITVGNILALPPQALEELRREIAATPDDHPTIGHDQAALARAERILAERRQSASARNLRQDPGGRTVVNPSSIPGVTKSIDYFDQLWRYEDDEDGAAIPSTRPP